MPAFYSLTQREAVKRANIHTRATGNECIVFRVWDTDTQPGGGFDWCPSGYQWQGGNEIADSDIVYTTQEGAP